MQEHFSASASQPTMPKNEDSDTGCRPKMQQQFSASASKPTIPKNENSDIGCRRKCSSNFRLLPGWMQAEKSSSLFRLAYAVFSRRRHARPGRAKFMQMVYAANQVNRA